jgi:hypothetical protein
MLLSNFLNNYIGKYAKLKRIPQELIGNMDLLLGLLDSDGSVLENSVIVIELCNYTLVEQIRQTLLLNGIIVNKVASTYKDITNDKGMYFKIRIPKAFSYKLIPLMSKIYSDKRMTIEVPESTKIFNSIKEIKKYENHKTVVYNLSVKDIHSYTLNGMLVKNCYVLPAPQDNIESIFDTAKEMARTFSYGGGVGISMKDISPKGLKINNAAKETTGAISFMEVYSKVTDSITQSGRR